MHSNSCELQISPRHLKIGQIFNFLLSIAHLKSSKNCVCGLRQLGGESGLRIFEKGQYTMSC